MLSIVAVVLIDSCDCEVKEDNHHHRTDSITKTDNNNNTSDSTIQD